MSQTNLKEQAVLRQTSQPVEEEANLTSQTKKDPVS